VLGGERKGAGRVDEPCHSGSKKVNKRKRKKARVTRQKEPAVFNSPSKARQPFLHNAGPSHGETNWGGILERYS